MSTSASIAPHGPCCWRTSDYEPLLRETDADNAGRETLIRDLAEAQYRHLVRPDRGLQAAEGWCQDVTSILRTADVAGIV